jgi:hypothetical protein
MYDKEHVLGIIHEQLASKKGFVIIFLSFSHAPEIAIIKSVINPTNNPTKIPVIKTLFVVCFLPNYT